MSAAVRGYSAPGAAGKYGPMTKGTAELIEGFHAWSVVVKGAATKSVVVEVSNNGTDFVTHTTVNASADGICGGAGTPYRYVRYTQDTGGTVTSVSLYCVR